MRTAMLALVLLISCVPNDPSALTIGAVLPLTGPGAVWGESVQEGMELAREELESQGLLVTVLYEDSEALAGPSVSAYRTLAQQGVDAVVVAISRAAVPLVPLADEDEIPLIVTLAASQGLAETSAYSYRLFSQERQQAESHFGKLEGERIAIFKVNDEAGLTIAQSVRRRAAREGIAVVAEESYEVGSYDYRSQIAKIKQSPAEAIFIAVSTPAELLAFLRQGEEAGLEIPVYETTVLLSLDSVRAQAGPLAEGVRTNAFSFTLNASGHEFRQAYEEKYGKSPLFGAAFGYDAVMLLAGAKREGGVQEGLQSLGSFDSLNGPVEIQPSGEINPEVHSVRIVNGMLME